MKKVLWCIPFLFVLSACGSSEVKQIVLENTDGRAHVDVALLFTREQLQAEEMLLSPVVRDEKGELVACQADDMDGDGKWDEFAFVYSLEPGQKAVLSLEWVEPEDYPQFASRTNIRYGKMYAPGDIRELKTDVHGKYNLARGEGYPYQMDGIAWENDKMGFRHYFDGRNCRDVFGKRVSDMVLDTVGIRPEGIPGDTYHVLAGWGRDIMSAANSFGLGGLALQTQDSLVRLGVTIDKTVDNVDSTRYALIAEGPVRSVFDLDFYGWEVPGGKIDVKETVTIWAGKFGYENKVRTSALPDSTYLVTGIVSNFNDMPYEKKQFGDYTAMMTHDKQTYNKEWYMGMALIIPNNNLAETFDAPKDSADIIKTWCARLKPDMDSLYHFNAYAAWELTDSKFSDREYFFSLIGDYADKMNRPYKVILK